MINSIQKLTLSLLCFVSVGLAAEKEATVRLKITDDAGEPVPNANVSISFNAYQHGLAAEVEAKSNAEGMVETKGWPQSEFMHSISVTSKTPGYYTSRLKQRANPEDREFELHLLIRKVEDPIAMYAKKVELELPEQRKEIGFDFEKGDWVKPYGKGEITDCTFIGEKAYEGDHKYECSAIVSFMGKQAGMLLDPLAGNKAIRQNAFKTSRVAPAENYQSANKFVWSWSKESGRKGSTEEANYIFRSRVVLDDSGKIKSCHYGKMIDAVNVASRSGYPDGNPIVKFTYYFNPTPNDRNLEFEPKLNLFPAPDGMIEVGQP